jgi:outer membrane protein TolC
VYAQQTAIAPVKPTTPVLGWYEAPFIPAVRLANTGRLASLMRGGKLYLTAQDAIALALENNLDIEIARYNPVLDQWHLNRAEAGGALPGVPTGSSQVGTVASGQGVSGSEASAGVSNFGGSNASGGTANATISQIGPTTPALDPILQNSTSFSHLSGLQPDVLAAGVYNLVQNARNYNTSLQTGFLTGGQVSLSYTESYLNENAPTDLLNPTYAPSLSFSAAQNFLSGFGVGVNSRTIDIWKTNLKIDDYNMRAQVTTIIVEVLQSYYTYSADFLSVAARQRAVDVANQFVENSRKQVQAGTLATLDITSAQANAASSERDLVIAQTTLAQHQLSLKNLLSRNGVAEPLLRTAEIMPLDHIEVPETDDLPPFEELVKEAQANRPDIAAERLNLQVAHLNSKGTGSAVLPQLAGFVTVSDAGLAGASTPVVLSLSPAQLQQQKSSGYSAGNGPCPTSYHTDLPCEFGNSTLVGGLGNAAGQVFRRDFPSESGGVLFSAILRNRLAQADYAIDQITIRQTQLQNARDLNQIAVDLSNQLIALQQARAQYQAAVKNRLLDEQVLNADQKKFKLGTSTPFEVMSDQSALALADYNVTSAMVTYSNARVALNETLGTTLNINHVKIENVLRQ